MSIQSIRRKPRKENRNKTEGNNVALTVLRHKIRSRNICDSTSSLIVSNSNTFKSVTTQIIRETQWRQKLCQHPEKRRRNKNIHDIVFKLSATLKATKFPKKKNKKKTQATTINLKNEIKKHQTSLNAVMKCEPKCLRFLRQRMCQSGTVSALAMAIDDVASTFRRPLRN